LANAGNKRKVPGGGNGANSGILFASLWYNPSEIKFYLRNDPGGAAQALSRRISTIMATARSMSSTRMCSAVECSCRAPIPTTAISMPWLL